jgi:hypothetical protein
MSLAPRPADRVFTTCNELTFDLIRNSLVPIGRIPSLAALRERARLLCMINEDPLGVALAEANDGEYMGPNNCLWLGNGGATPPKAEAAGREVGPAHEPAQKHE